MDRPVVFWCSTARMSSGYRGTGGATADLFPTRIRRKHGGTNRTNSQPYPIGLAYGPRERSSGIRQGYGDTLSGRALMQVSACVRSIGIGYAVKVCSRPGARASARADLILDTRNYKTPHKWGVRGGEDKQARPEPVSLPDSGQAVARTDRLPKFWFESQRCRADSLRSQARRGLASRRRIANMCRSEMVRAISVSGFPRRNRRRPRIQSG